MYRTLFVPLDGSPESEQALPLACSLTRRGGAKLRLAHVHRAATNNPIYVEGLPVIDSELHSRADEHARAYLERTCSQLTANFGVECSCSLLQGDGAIPAVLLDDAARADADLVVMTTHGRSGFAHLWLGSVAEQLIRLSALPLLLQRPAKEPLPREAVPSPKRLLIPLDGSAFAEQILEPALQLGRALDAAYILLQVVESRVVLHGNDLSVAPVDPAPQNTEREVAAAQAYLDGVAQGLTADGHQVETRVLVAERTAATLLGAAHAQPDILLAIATHGRSGLTRLLWGSVADKVLRGAHCPVLVYRPRQTARR